jgi:hypothetical protein
LFWVSVLTAALLLMFASGMVSPAIGADEQAADIEATATERIDRPKPTEEARRSYLSRVLAEPMSHLGAAWLVRPERELEENATRALKQLELRPGMQVCDLGCGNGYWTLPIAGLTIPLANINSSAAVRTLTQNKLGREANRHAIANYPAFSDAIESKCGSKAVSNE